MASLMTTGTAGLFAFLLVSWLVLAAVPAAGDEIPAAEDKVPDVEMIRHQLKELFGPENPSQGKARFQLSVPHFRHRDRPDVLIPETDLRKHKKNHKNKKHKSKLKAAAA